MIINNNIQLALGAIRNNMLRTILTVMIIAVGITCLVGILTAIDTILFSLNDNFNRMGANSIMIQPLHQTIRKGGERKTKTSQNISFEEARNFKKQFHSSGAKVSTSVYCGSGLTASLKDKKTDPSIRLLGIDEHFLKVNAYEIEYGRNFNQHEINEGVSKIVIGRGLIKSLFDGKGEKAVGKSIKIDNYKYFVIGTLKEKGTTANSNDNNAYIPLLRAKVFYGHPKSYYRLNIILPNAILMEEAISDAIGVMRNVRGIKPGEDNDFEVRKSDGLLVQLKEMSSKLRIASIAIALITLLGAAIGLMNIMLVSVTERTKEIGIRKALGATRSNIRVQFLTEAVVICQIGGVLGVVFGIGIGFLVAYFIKGTFIIPWLWMLLAFVVCILVGILAGLIPAIKASKLDPIEALRYE